MEQVLSMDEATAKAKVAEIQAIQRPNWMRVWAAQYGHGLTNRPWGVFGETDNGLYYRWNEVDGKFYYWGANA